MSTIVRIRATEPDNPDSTEFVAEMLGVYTLWAENRGQTVRLLPSVGDFETNRLRDVYAFVSGNDSYDLLLSEHGLHRLVKIGTTDPNRRRVTVFCQVDIIRAAEEGEEVPEPASSSEIVRTIVLAPYLSVKDHRSDKGTSHPDLVLKRGLLTPDEWAQFGEKLTQ